MFLRLYAGAANKAPPACVNRLLVFTVKSIIMSIVGYESQPIAFMCHKSAQLSKIANRKKVHMDSPNEPKWYGSFLRNTTYPNEPYDNRAIKNREIVIDMLPSACVMLLRRISSCGSASINDEVRDISNASRTHMPTGDNPTARQAMISGMSRMPPDPSTWCQVWVSRSNDRSTRIIMGMLRQRTAAPQKKPQFKAMSIK